MSTRTRLSPAATAAAAAVDAELVNADLAALVRMRSVTGDEDAIQATLADWLEALGMAVEIFHPDPAAIREDPEWPGEEVERTILPVVIGRAGRRGSFRLVLSGHVDVVPAGDPATWIGDAFSGETRDGRLYGRGACDMKGGIAAILGAVRALGVTCGLDALQGELIVAFVPSEEDGGQGTLAAIRAGVTGDLCVIPEPSSLDVVVAHAGAITFRLTVPGRAAHASRRTEEAACVFLPVIVMVNRLLLAMAAPTLTPRVPTCSVGSTCRPKTAAGTGPAKTPASSIRCAPDLPPSGSPSSAGWKRKTTVPGISARMPLKISATPSAIDTWPSWPQACLTLGTVDL